MMAGELDPQLLASMDLFQGLPADALATVAAHARLRRLDRDVRIFSQGDPADRQWPSRRNAG